jgi:IS4 transposase
VYLYDQQGKQVNWKQLSRGRTLVDQSLYIGKEERVAVRMVMLKVPAAVVNERIRKAKAHRDKRGNHSADYYQRLHYDIFITNVEEQVADAKGIAQLYRIRWQVEMLFKCFKSSFGVQQVLFWMLQQ